MPADPPHSTALQPAAEPFEPPRGDAGAEATRDALTGLVSRPTLERLLPSMLATAQQDQQPLAVVMIDLDHFKHVNDRFGHAAGDTMLKSFGELLTKQGARSDIVGRWGGEEFCLLLPDTDALAARRRINALLTLWRGAEFRFGMLPCSDNTFSAGIADSVLAPPTAGDLLQAAAACLLEAKRLGCQRALVFDAFALGAEEAD